MEKIFAYILSMLLLSGAGYESLEYVPIVTTLVAMYGNDDEDDNNNLAQLNLPMSVFSGEDGALYVLDTYNNLIRHIDSYGKVERVAGNIIMLDENIPLQDSLRFPRGFYQDGALDVAMFNHPTAGVKDSEGRIFIADRSNHAIRVIYEGYVFTLAGGREAGYRNGRGIEVMFYYPSALTLDGRGNLIVADTGNNAIRRIGVDGRVTTIAGMPGLSGYQNGDTRRALFNQPMGIAVREDGTILVADSGNHLIRSIEGRRVSTIAGIYQLPGVETEDEWERQPLGGFNDGNSNEAMFNMPVGLALWEDVIIIADSVNHAIRAVLDSGEVITITGTGYPGYVDGSLKEAMFHLPQGVYIHNDKLLIVDTGNHMIRKTTLLESVIRVEDEDMDDYNVYSE